jgi:hypothetical protein
MRHGHKRAIPPLSPDSIFAIDGGVTLQGEKHLR